MSLKTHAPCSTICTAVLHANLLYASEQSTCSLLQSMHTVASVEAYLQSLASQCCIQDLPVGDLSGGKGDVGNDMVLQQLQQVHTLIQPSRIFCSKAPACCTPQLAAQKLLSVIMMRLNSRERRRVSFCSTDLQSAHTPSAHNMQTMHR